MPPWKLAAILVLIAVAGCDEGWTPPPVIPGSPAVDTALPDTDAPDTDAPDADAPDVDAPDVDAPDVDAPDVDAPDVDAPDVDAPDAGAATPSIDVPSNTVNKNNLTVSYILPPDWTQAKGEDADSFLFSAEATAALEEGNALVHADMLVKILDNPNGLSLDSFIANDSGGWFATYIDRTPRLVGEYEALIMDDRNAQLPKKPSPVAFIAVNNAIVLVLGYELYTREFNLLLDSLIVQ